MELFLRPVIESDLPVLFEQQADTESSRMAAVASRERDVFDAHWTKILADDAIWIRTIVCDGEVAGHVLSFVREGEREVGYWIGRAYWGRGIATRALQLFLAEFSERPLHAHAAKHNPGSIRVLEKCGFRITGENDGLSGGRNDGVPEYIFRLEVTRR